MLTVVSGCSEQRANIARLSLTTSSAMLGACQFPESDSWHDSCNRQSMSMKLERGQPEAGAAAKLDRKRYDPDLARLQKRVHLNVIGHLLDPIPYKDVPLRGKIELPIARLGDTRRFRTPSKRCRIGSDSQ